MPEIRPVTIEPVLLPAIGRIPEIRALPEAPPVTLQLGMPVVDMPGCVPVHPDAKLNPSLLKDDPGRTGAYCPHGQVPSFRPMDFTPNELVVVESDDPGNQDEGSDEKPEAAKPESVPRLPESSAKGAEETTEAKQPSKSFVEKAVDGLPPVEAVVTTTTIALVAATSALVAKPLADLILKLIKPTVKKAVKKVSQLKGQPPKVESVRERVLAQRDRNRALMALRRALKP
jgi:hypothetical protein